MSSLGRLLVIDGIDGSGKGTQARLLLDILKRNGIKAELFDFPRYGEKSAVLVQEYLCGNFGTSEEVSPYQAAIFYAVDRYVASKQMKKLLAQGVFLIANRYVSSSKGHQAVRIAEKAERTKFLSWLNNLEYTIFDIPRPDMTIFLQVPSEIAYELVLKKDKRDYIGDKKQDILEADKEHLKQAEKMYLELSSGLDTFENWRTISSCKNGNILPVETISSMIVGLVNHEFKLDIMKEVG